MNKFKFTTIITMVIMIVVGAFLVIHPGDTIDIAAVIVGLALLAVGIFSILSQLLKKEDKSMFSILVGALEVLAGIVVLAHPRFVLSLFPVIVGIVVVLYGISDLMAALQLKKAGGNATAAVVFAVIAIVLGAICVFLPIEAVKLTVRVIGAVLVYKGITGLFIQLRNKA